MVVVTEAEVGFKERSNELEVYKGETLEVLNRFLIHRLKFPGWIAALDAALAGPNAGECRTFQRDSLSQREADFRDLQLQTDPFTIDQHEARINKLLPRAIKLFIGPQHR